MPLAESTFYERNRGRIGFLLASMEEGEFIPVQNDRRIKIPF